MITRGIVRAVVDDYSYRVYMPHYTANVLEADLPIARVCAPPGYFPHYQVDDVVYISFENDELDDPVIVGLLLGTSSTSTADVNANSLSVDVDCSLPISGTGENQAQVDSDIQGQIEDLQSQINKAVFYHIYGVLVERDDKDVPIQEDLDLLNEYLDGDVSLSPWQLKAADLNGDGSVTSADADLLQDYLDGEYSVTSRAGELFLCTKEV